MACHKGVTLSVLGVYGMIDKFSIGVIIHKGMTVRTAQQHGQAYMDRLLAHAQESELNPAHLATHRFSLEDPPLGYDLFNHKRTAARAVFAPQEAQVGPARLAASTRLPGDGRVVVKVPRRSEDAPVSVAEVAANG